jgi:hypothetical protein
MGVLGVYFFQDVSTVSDGLFRGAGGGKCPEEEHTTCSGGPTINCHKRGLRGERIFIRIQNSYKYKVENVVRVKMLKHEKTLFYP